MGHPGELGRGGSVWAGHDALHGCREPSRAELLHDLQTCTAAASLCGTNHTNAHILHMPDALPPRMAWQVDAERRVARLLAAEQAILDKCFPRHGKCYIQSSTHHSEVGAGKEGKLCQAGQSKKALLRTPPAEYSRTLERRRVVAGYRSLARSNRRCVHVATLYC